ncbi:uncharacterized protein LOC131400304 [Diceros bicornis minor]|uniref:uncharacterized protein LOC131400304 n=1 Tax=Diceros bicornis minor TaxID=77932 RepID=UPI0026EDC9AF|nr:uncharacterized protein LOC131400304 [Diceros bicornis minor]
MESLELDYSFLVYGENFERAEINREKLLNITWQTLNELGIIRTDHQDIILKAVANIYRKSKVEEQAMQGEDQNDKKMPTRFRKQSEHLEHAIDRVLVMISERRRTRTLHGANEQPPHNILTAALELINMVKMILNTLERPPFDCMSEFSSLKSHLIKHITLLKHFSEQSDLSHEMESDMIDVCKGVTKICHYLMALPPDLAGPETQIPKFITPEEKPPREQVRIAIEPEAMNFSMEHGPDYVPPARHLSMPITTASSSSEPIFPLQGISLQNEIAPDRFEYFSPKMLNTQSNEGAVMMPRDEGNKFETEISDTKDSETSAGSLHHKSLQDLTVIESDTPLLDSGSERCAMDSDSDRGIGLDSDLEQHSKDSDSILWGMDSDSEKHLMDSDSVKCQAEKYQMASGSGKDLMESEQHLVGVEQCWVDFDSLKHWMDLDSENCLEDSDSEEYVMDSDSEKPEIDSDSEKYPIASASVKHLLKAEKCQMALDSVKRLMESEKRLMETEQHWMFSASERYVMDSDVESDGMDSASAPGVHLMGEEKHQEKTRSKIYMMDSESETCRMDSERYGLASGAVKCLMDAKTSQLSTDTEKRWMDFWSERRTKDLDSESLGIASDSVKHMMKAENCQRASHLEKFWMDLRSESERCWTDSERQELDFGYGRCWDSSRIYRHRSARLQGSSERCQDDFQKEWDNLERHEIDSDSEKHQGNSDNERYQNKFESERHMMKMKRKQCLIQSENQRLQVDEKRERYLVESDSEKEHRIVSDNERHHLDSENEAQRLGARRKDNRPQGFWRPVFLSPPLGQGRETEEQHSVQQIDNKVSRIQLIRYLSDDKIVRFKEVSPTLTHKQDSQPKLKEKHSHNPYPDRNTFMDNKHHRNASYKISVSKSRCKNYRYQQSFQSSGFQMNSIHLLSAEDYTSEVSAPACHPTSMSPWSAVCLKTHTGAPICSKCFMEINNSFHKCLMNSDDDSDPDCPLHFQISLDSKYFLNPKSIKHCKTSQNRPLSQSLDPKHPVDIQCPLHQEDSKYSLGSTTYLPCKSCSALQNLIDSTVTHTFPLNPQNTMAHRNTPDPDNVINTSNVASLKSEGKFNLIAKLENEANPDNETKLVSAGNLKDKANAEDKPLLKDDTDCEDETDSEDDKDSEDEIDSEDENNTKDKKDPKDKSDPDDTDPKDSNAENDAGTNNGSDPSGDADPTSGADSNSDGDSNNGTDSNSEPDSNINNATNNNANSKYSTDSEEDKHTNNSGDASGLDSHVVQNCTAESNNDTNPDYTSRLQNGTGLDYTSGSNSGAGPSNATGSGNDICSNNDTGPSNGPGPNNNRLGPNIKVSGFQNNGSDSQNIRPGPNDSGPNINGLGPNNSPVPNNNSPGSNHNSPSLKKDSDSNFNSRPSNATDHNSAISPNKDTDSNYDTKPTSAAGRNYAAISNYDSDFDYVPGFTHAVGSSFVVNPNYIARNSYAARPTSTSNTVNVTDTSNTTSYSGTVSPSYTAGTNCASDSNHDPRFTHIIDCNSVINPNYDAIGTHNVRNSTSTSNIDNLSEPELEIGADSSIYNIFYGNSPTFAAGTIYTSTLENLTTSKFYYSSKLGRNYTTFDEHKCSACLKVFAGSMDSASFHHATESKDVLDAKECSFLKDFSRVQNSIGIKDLASLNFHSNSSILLPSFDIIVEAELPDVVKFAISSGAVNQFFKLNLQTGIRQSLGT